MVLGSLGGDFAEAHLAHVMGSYWFGTPASHVLRLSSLGYRVTYERASFEQLRVYLSRQVPCIVFYAPAVCHTGMRMFHTRLL